MKNDTYPDIADTVLGQINIPVVPREELEQFARPDTIKTYIPPEVNEESDEEDIRESERRELVNKYKDKRIDRITKKFKNATGQVKYNVVWTKSSAEEV